MMQPAANAASHAKYHLLQNKEDQYIVETATNQSQEEDSVAAEDSAEEAQEINN
jgi:hypothetical protein